MEKNSLKIMVGGSLHLRSLPEALRSELEDLVEGDTTFLVGDAAGIDAHFQRLFMQWRVSKVLVHFSGLEPRYNLGGWPLRRIDSGLKSKSAAMHGAKDRVMVASADRGLMVWDGSSVGTITNILDLAGSLKPWSLWLVDGDSATTIKTVEELRRLFPEVVLEAEKRLVAARRRAEKAARKAEAEESPLF